LVAGGLPGTGSSIRRDWKSGTAIAAEVGDLALVGAVELHRPDIDDPAALDAMTQAMCLPSADHAGHASNSGSVVRRERPPFGRKV
jgi:hypothetical protein